MRAISAFSWEQHLCPARRVVKSCPATCSALRNDKWSHQRLWKIFIYSTGLFLHADYLVKPREWWWEMWQFDRKQKTNAMQSASDPDHILEQEGIYYSCSASSACIFWTQTENVPVWILFLSNNFCKYQNSRWTVSATSGWRPLSHCHSRVFSESKELIRNDLGQVSPRMLYGHWWWTKHKWAHRLNPESTINPLVTSIMNLSIGFDLFFTAGQTPLVPVVD